MNAHTTTVPQNQHVYGNAIVHTTRHITNSIPNVFMGNIGMRGLKM